MAKRIGSIAKLKLIADLRSRRLMERVLKLAEQYCPEMLAEEVTSAEDINKWVDRLIQKFPEDIRKEFE